MTATPIAKATETNKHHAAHGLLRHLADAFKEGGLDKLNGELHSLCGALAYSTPAHAAAVEAWLAERAQASQEAAIAARASFA